MSLDRHQRRYKVLNSRKLTDTILPITAFHLHEACHALMLTTTLEFWILFILASPLLSSG
jgi:hypothetical protein